MKKHGDLLVIFQPWSLSNSGRLLMWEMLFIYDVCVCVGEWSV